MITADELGRRLSGLDDIGVGPDGAVNRLAWTPEAAACGAWFDGQAAALDREVLVDPAGNLWAPPPGVEPPWWAAGSHLDSVRGGGRFDGPLGVVAAFAVAAQARAPVAVLCLADEEGARFNTPTFGSRALAGRLDPAVLDRPDDDGVPLREALAHAGVDPDGLARAPEWLERLRGFLELHIDQTRELAEQERACGVVGGLAARRRLQVDLYGRFDHAGTTPMEGRADALAAAARLIVAAEEAAGPGMRVTATRLLAEPNALTTIAGHVRLWFDVRAPQTQALDEWEGWLRSGEAAVTVASASPAVAFDRDVRAALGGGHELLSYAGHDAGILGERIPAGMVFVRNPTGVSHAPQEAVSLEDAAAGATALLRAVETLASAG